MRAIVSPVAIPVKPAVPVSNESKTWAFLTSRGYTAYQTAGIMGNLMQEHRFKTSDTPGGLGIAQWIGSRRHKLMQRRDHTSLNTQLEYLLEELSTNEKHAGDALRRAQTVEEATIAFQNMYERCGVCMQSQRLSYAYEILQKYSDM